MAERFSTPRPAAALLLLLAACGERPPEQATAPSAPATPAATLPAPAPAATAAPSTDPFAGLRVTGAFQHGRLSVFLLHGPVAAQPDEAALRSWFTGLEEARKQAKAKAVAPPMDGHGDPASMPAMRPIHLILTMQVHDADKVRACRVSV